MCVVCYVCLCLCVCAVLQVPEIERKVKYATNNDKWGPHTKDMAELARATYA